MNSDVIQFQCGACQTVLTVPSYMAGVSGPCPVCGQTITSPGAPEPSVPLFTTPPPAPAAPPAPEPEPPAAASMQIPATLLPTNTGLNPGLAPSKPSLNPGLNPVMPMPNSITQHLQHSGRGLSTPSSLDNVFPSTPPASVVQPAPSPAPSTPQAEFPSAPWQQPGLGQTLLGGLPQPPPISGPSVFPTSSVPSSASGLNNPYTPPPQPETPHAASAATPPSSPWSSLQPKNEIPAAPPANEGLGFFGSRPATGAPTHSSLIPGNPSLPSQAPAAPPAVENHGFGAPAPAANIGFGAPPAAPAASIGFGASPATPAQTGFGASPPGLGASLLTREISPTPPAPTKPAFTAPIPTVEQPPAPPTAEAPPAAAAPTLPPAKISTSLKKPSKSSNVFMRALAAVFLIGFLVAAGWMFRAPLKQLVNRFIKPAPEPVAFVLPEPDPNYKPEDDVKDTAPKTTEPETAVAATPAPKAPENPPATEPEPAAPPRAEVPSAEELAALRSQPAAPTLTEVPAQTSTDSAAMASAPTAPEPTGKATPIKIETTEEGRPAAEALIKFLKAKNLNERLRYTLAGNSMKPLMERYYQAQPDGPLHIDAIGLVRLDRKPQMGSGTHALFGVESRDWEYPVPVMLEENKNGYQVDWLSFVEFKDRLLEKFFESYQDGAARFHVGITRTHYFDDKVPNSDNKDAFTLSPAPPNPYQTTVFVEKDSQVGRDLKDRIPWGAQVWAIVDLEWVKLGNQQWVQLVGVPQLNWYSVPNESKAGKSSDLPNEIQRAVPVGR